MAPEMAIFAVTMMMTVAAAGTVTFIETISTAVVGPIIVVVRLV
jgi:hypothetical protein